MNNAWDRDELWFMVVVRVSLTVAAAANMSNACCAVATWRVDRWSKQMSPAFVSRIRIGVLLLGSTRSRRDSVAAVPM